MRDFLAGVLVLGGLAALGYAAWVFVQRRRGKPRREGAPRVRVLLLAAFIAFLLGGAIAPAERAADEQEAAGTTATTTTATTATTATTPQEAPAQVFARAEEAVDDDDYAQAVAIVAVLGAADKDRIARKISRRLSARALSALRRGNRRAASRLLRRAGNYPSTPQARAARRSLRASRQRAAARRAERRRQRELAREQERQRRAAERAQREAEEQEAAEPDAPSAPSGTCDEVGISDFPVPPGDDRDQDGDGVACES